LCCGRGPCVTDVARAHVDLDDFFAHRLKNKGSAALSLASPHQKVAAHGASTLTVERGRRQYMLTRRAIIRRAVRSSGVRPMHRWEDTLLTCSLRNSLRPYGSGAKEQLADLAPAMSKQEEKTRAVLACPKKPYTGTSFIRPSRGVGVS
jgi:hypothetical protein